MADDSVIVRFGGSIEGLTTAVEGARASIESLAAPFTGLTSAIGGLGESFAAAFAVHEIDHFVESMAELGLQTSRTSQILGVSTEEVGGLSLIAKASGVSIEELQHAFAGLSKAVIEESDPAKRALAALGLSFADIRNLTPEKQLELLASKFADIKDGADKNAIALALLGRAGQQMIPLFNQGAEGMQHWADVAKETGTALSKETVKALDEMHAALIEVDAAITGVSIKAFLEFRGALAGVVQLVRDLTTGFRNAGTEGGAAASAVGLVEVAVKGLAAGLVWAKGLSEEMWSVFSFGAEGAGMWVNEVITQLRNLGLAMKNLSFAGVKDEWAFFKDQMTQRAQQAKHDIISAHNEMFRELHMIFAAGDKKIEEAHAQSQARMAAASAGGNGKTDTDAISAAMKEVDGEVKALQEGLAFKKTVWAGEVAAHHISKEQELADVVQATDREYQAELALLQKEKGIGGLKISQIQEINNKIEQLQAKHNLEMIKLDQQALAEETASWERAFQTITTSFNSQLRGLITGTTNFKNAFKSILTDILVKFIEVVENMAVKWAAGQLAETTATLTGAQERAGAETAGAAASNAGTISAVLHSISASAAETFAGIFGFLSPVLGPAAAGPAAGGEATVLAAGAAVGGLALGAWSLPSDMLAMVHRGEMVIPAGVTPWAQGVISGAANTPGVSTVHVHHATNFTVSAMDARGVRAFFNDHGRTILRTINEGTRTGAHLGLSKLGAAT
ncbi:MAG: hypothetical protein ACREC9_13575 [Methylocella sp.]